MYPTPNRKTLILAKVLIVIIILGIQPIVWADSDAKIKTIALPIAEKVSDFENDELIPVEELEKMTYTELEALREPRKLLISYLIKEGKIRESHKGTIDFLDHLNEVGRIAVKEENLTRRQMFTLLSKLEKRSIASIGREFHDKTTSIPEKKEKRPEPVIEIPTSLRVNAPVSLGKTLVPNLVGGYLQSLGYGDVNLERKNGVTRLIGRRSFGSGFLAVDLENRLPGSTVSPKNKCLILDIGESSDAPGTFGVQGIAVVVHPDNPVTTLSISQVADIFSGKIKTWSELKDGGDGDISVILPGTRPVLTSQFREMVMDPYDEKLLVSESTSGDDHLKQIEENPYAIAFCLPGEMKGKLKSIRIKSASDALPLSPSSINLKTLDYPLLRFISVKAHQSTDTFMKEFISYCQSDAGQNAVNKSTGYIAAGASPLIETPDEDNHRRTLLSNPDVPETYKEAIAKADRKNSPSNFRFIPGTSKFELTDHSQASLDALARYLRSSPDQYKNVILIGFADSYGDAEANRIYSGKRADSIAEKLTEKGITNIVTLGIGEEMPVADNDKEEGRAANRRVEVWLER